MEKEIILKKASERKLMNLEQQVTNLELSKKLKSLGVKQESLFWWVREMTNKRNYKLESWNKQYAV